MGLSPLREAGPYSTPLLVPGGCGCVQSALGCGAGTTLNTAGGTSGPPMRCVQGSCPSEGMIQFHAWIRLRLCFQSGSLNRPSLSVSWGVGTVCSQPADPDFMPVMQGSAVHTSLTNVLPKFLLFPQGWLLHFHVLPMQSLNK